MNYISLQPVCHQLGKHWKRNSLAVTKRLAAQAEPSCRTAITLAIYVATHRKSELQTIISGLFAGLDIIDSVGNFLQGLFGVRDVSSGSFPGFVAILARTKGKGVHYR